MLETVIQSKTYEEVVADIAARQAIVRALFDDFGGLLDAADFEWLKWHANTKNTASSTMVKCERLRAKVDAKIAKVLARNAVPLPFWTEDTVISATRYMTSLDLDQAGQQNGSGWSGRDTKLGHWATKAFRGPHNDLALRVARILCGGYVHTQLRGFHA